MEDAASRNPLSRPARVSNYGIGPGLAGYVLLAVSHWSYVPFWDSMENLEEYLFLPRRTFTFDNLLLMHNGHPALGYFWPFWIGQFLFPSRLLVVHFINLLFGALAVISFGRVAALAFQGLAGAGSIALVTVAFAIHPVFVAYALNMSPDYGVLAYFLATLWLLYENRPGWAALTGTLLVFSKEIGIPSYGLLVVFYLSGAIRPYRWRAIWPLVLPFLGFALFALYQHVQGRPVLPWAGRFMKNVSPWATYLPNPFKADFGMACLGPLVLEFQWIFTAVILAGLVHGLAVTQPAAGAGFHPLRRWSALNLPFRCFLFLFAGVLYIDSRIVIFTNQRYFFVLYPLVLLLFLAALIELKWERRAGIPVLAAGIGLLVLCNFRTLDPVSRALAGTFSFGRHPILSIATIRPDFGDLNRDQMVYNLEHTQLAGLLDQAFAQIRPDNSTVFVMPGDAWYVFVRLDAATFRRTVSTQPPYIKPKLIGAEALVHFKAMPETIYAICLPYYNDRRPFDILLPFYRTTRCLTFDHDGYELQVKQMSRIPATSAAVAGPSFLPGT